MSTELEKRRHPALPSAPPPRGLSWRESFEGDAWCFRVRPTVTGRQIVRPIVALVIASLAAVCQWPIVVALGVGLAIYGARPTRRNVLTLGPAGFVFVGRTSIDRLADIDHFDTVVDELPDGRTVTLVRAVLHAGTPVAFVIDAVDHVMAVFVASRLNVALAQLRDVRGYRG